MKPISKYIFIFLCYHSMLQGCKKEWLDAKPQTALITPNAVADYQAILDNTAASSNAAPFNINQSILDELGAGDFYVSDAALNSANPIERNTYLWQPDIYAGDENISEWTVPYKRIYYANIILEGIDKIVPSTTNDRIAWDNVKGSAFFFRAYSHYNISQMYAKPYDQTNAQTELGIPLRRNSDYYELSVRSTVKETYDLIITDLKEANRLLPQNLPVVGSDTILYRLRPTKAAASAMLARVYLSMGMYDSAFAYADKTLSLYNILIDYNTLTASSNTPVAQFGKEVIFHMRGSNWALLSPSNLIVDSTLYRSYSNDDLRRSIFYRTNAGNLTFKGSYAGSSLLFTGLATDEIYLIRAECYARQGNMTLALQDLNTLVRKRWRNTVTYPVITAANAGEALVKVLNERRKELCFRGIRWSDLRRLNRETQFASTLIRKSNAQTFTLPANDSKYTLPIPPTVIGMTGMAQNERF